MFYLHQALPGSVFVPDSIYQFMVPSIDHDALLIANARRLTGKAIRKLMQPMVLGMAILVFATGIGNGLPQSSAIKAQPAEHHHAVKRSHHPVEHRRSTSKQQPLTNQRLFHQRMTKALMTNHNLTAARFSSDSSTKRPSTDTDTTSQHG